MNTANVHPWCTASSSMALVVHTSGSTGSCLVSSASVEMRPGALQGSGSEDLIPHISFMVVPGGSRCKESACNAGDAGLIPGSGRSLGGGNGNPVQYSCLENPTARGACQAALNEVIKSQTQLKCTSLQKVFILLKWVYRVTVHHWIVFS